MHDTAVLSCPFFSHFDVKEAFFFSRAINILEQVQLSAADAQECRYTGYIYKHTDCSVFDSTPVVSKRQRSAAILLMQPGSPFKLCEPAAVHNGHSTIPCRRGEIPGADG